MKRKKAQFCTDYMTTRKLGVGVAQNFSNSQRLRVLAPWGFTGPVSDVEWRDVPVRADEYRSQSPASSSQVVVPQTTTSKVYATRYYIRDSRRNNVSELHGSTFTTTKISKETLRDLANTPMDSGQYYGRLRIRECVSLLDDPSAGYA